GPGRPFPRDRRRVWDWRWAEASGPPFPPGWFPRQRAPGFGLGRNRWPLRPISRASKGGVVSWVGVGPWEGFVGRGIARIRSVALGLDHLIKEDLAAIGDRLQFELHEEILYPAFPEFHDPLQMPQ